MGTAAAAQPAGNLKQFCSGASNYTEFSDKSGYDNVALREDGVIRVFRHLTAESGDWSIEDSYVFLPSSGERREASRIVRYAGPPYRYVKIVDASGRSTDNIAALPEGWFIPEEPMLANQAAFCRLKAE